MSSLSFQESCTIEDTAQPVILLGRYVSKDGAVTVDVQSCDFEEYLLTLEIVRSDSIAIEICKMSPNVFDLLFDYVAP